MAISAHDNAIEVFFSYSHKDEDLRDELDKHFASLKHQRQIKAWHDRRILPSENWNEEITKNLNSCDVILLLISSDFLNSDFCYNNELKRAMERHSNGEACVIPIVLRPVVWQGELIGNLQMLPKDAKPVTSWSDRDEAWVSVVQGVWAAIEKMAKKKVAANRESSLPRFLPRPPRVGFVMRKDRNNNDLLNKLKDELGPQRRQLVTLWGPGGVGKTTIASEVVRSLANTFSGRTVWTGPQQRADFSFTILLDEIATQLGEAGIRQLGIEQKKEQVRELISLGPTLIVLDNFETIASPEQVRCVEWLQDTPCSVLITTRDKIDNTLNISIAEMSQEEAFDFLSRLTKHVHDPDSFTGLDRDLIVKTAERNPLVLEWVAAQIDEAQEPSTVLEELKRGEGDVAARIFDRSFNLPQVDEDGRAVMLALSLFLPSASRSALAQVAGFGNHIKLLNQIVKRLARLWLVRAKEGNMRLAIEGLTKELAAAHLAKAKSSNEFYHRFVACFLQYVETHSGVTPEALDALEGEKDNILSAVDISLKLGDWSSTIQICDLLAEPINGFLSIHGYWDEAIRCNQHGLEAAHKSENGVQIARFKHNLGVVCHKRGDFYGSRRLQEESLQIARQHGDRFGTARTLHQLGILALEEKNWSEAQQLYTESLNIGKELNDKQGMSRTLRQLGNCAHLQGELKDAGSYYIESLEIGREVGDQRGIANTLHELGNLAYNQGDIAKARQYYDESIDIAQKLKYQSCIGRTLYQLALLAEKEGNNAKALLILREALEILRRLGSRFAEYAQIDLKRIEAKNY